MLDIFQVQNTTETGALPQSSQTPPTRALPNARAKPTLTIVNHALPMAGKNWSNHTPLWSDNAPTSAYNAQNSATKSPKTHF